jgi:hypothetical protein
VAQPMPSAEVRFPGLFTGPILKGCFGSDFVKNTDFRVDHKWRSQQDGLRNFRQGRALRQRSLALGLRSLATHPFEVRPGKCSDEGDFRREANSGIFNEKSVRNRPY